MGSESSRLISEHVNDDVCALLCVLPMRKLCSKGTFMEEFGPRPTLTTSGPGEDPVFDRVGSQVSPVGGSRTLLRTWSAPVSSYV